MSFLWLKLSFWLLFTSVSAETGAALELSGAKPECRPTCGNITIPYPLGIGVECARSKGLNVTCNSTYNPPRPFLEASNIEILGISSAEVRIKNFIAFICYNESGYITNQHRAWIRLFNKHYTFSDESNKFVSVGCNAIAFIQGPNFVNYTSGCFTVCRKKYNVLNGSCAGVGCCQTSIPKGLKYYETYISRPYTDWNVESYRFSPCSYAFLADQNVFQFQASDINSHDFC